MHSIIESNQHSHLEHGVRVVWNPEHGQRNSRLMFAIHRKKVVERNFGGYRLEEWLNVMNAVL